MEEREREGGRGKRPGGGRVGEGRGERGGRKVEERRGGERRGERENDTQGEKGEFYISFKFHFKI